jgi:hypothetical protein
MVPFGLALAPCGCRLPGAAGQFPNATLHDLHCKYRLNRLCLSIAGKRPVPLYPDRFVSMQHKGGAQVWVLTLKRLSGFLEHQNRALSAEDVSLLAYHLSR